MRNSLFACLILVFVCVSAFGQEDGTLTVAKQMIDQANSELAATGSNVRIVKASFFVRGHGVPDFRNLRIGTKWPFRTVSYIVDGSDMTVDVPAANAAAAIVSGYNSWNAIENTNITAVQAPDNGTNFDVLDGTFHPVTGACLTIFDITSPNLNLSNGTISPAADIVVGGWLKPQYFSSCLGSSSILGVTFTFADGDVNSDQYIDTLYVEQYYNEGFAWVTNGAVFLGPTQDIESVVVHENGHALGLDHTGGPNLNQPFKLHPNLRVFSPEAVMNPFYLGGDDKRAPLPTDVAGLRTLYSNPQ
jgi:hypothetical protein